MIGFLKNFSSIYLTISLVLTILAVLSQIVVLFVKKEKISFSEFNKKVSIFDNYFDDFSMIIFFLDLFFI